MAPGRAIIKYYAPAQTEYPPKNAYLFYVGGENALFGGVSAHPSRIVRLISYIANIHIGMSIHNHNGLIYSYNIIYSLL